jgi:F-type H+-transporting ATPase subunit a
MNFILPIILAAGVPLKAQSPLEGDFIEGLHWLEWFTNSVFVAAIVVVVVVLWARSATRSMQVVPGLRQNLFEALVEGLYDTFEGIVGHHMAGKVFPLLASMFIFILVANWFALLPGVGSIGWGPGTGFLTVKEVDVPLLRPATADLNMTLGIAAVFMVLWLFWTIQELGVKGFLDHTFGVKGGLKGLMALCLFPIFLFVGLIEVVSIAFRPVSLSLRLFGNVFAGENLLVTMITLGKQLGLPEIVSAMMSIIIPIPFYFLEVLIGLLQAAVFTLLCAVYIQLSTSHDEEAH